jgi:hypothetical protein
MQMTFPTPTTATIGHTASRMQRGHILSARSPSLPDRLHQRRGNFEQAGTKPIASDHAEAPKIRWRNVAVRCKLLCSRSPLVRPMLNTRSPIFVAAGLVLLVAVAAAQPSTTPMKMLDDFG